MTNQAFIDGQNLRLSTTRANKSWKVDLQRFRIYLEKKYQVSQAYYFIGCQVDEYQKLYQSITDAGYILVFRQHDCEMASVKKGNVDTDIVFSVMRKLVEREKFAKVILVSGDGDYSKMVQFLIKKGKLGKVLAPNEKTFSSLYKKHLEPKYYAFLNRPEVKNKIAQQKKGRRHKKMRVLLR